MMFNTRARAYTVVYTWQQNTKNFCCLMFTFVQIVSARRKSSVLEISNKENIGETRYCKSNIVNEPDSAAIISFSSSINNSNGRRQRTEVDI